MFGEDADVAEEVLGVDIDTSFSAWHGLGGVLLGLLTLVLVAWLIVRLAAVNIPLPVSQAMTAAVLGVLILFLAVIKNLADDESTLWSYLGVVLAVGSRLRRLAAGAGSRRRRQAEVRDPRHRDRGGRGTGRTGAAPPRRRPRPPPRPPPLPSRPRRPRS